MTIDEQLILKIEHLARLQLTNQEREQIRGDLNNILTMVSKLEELDTEGVEPLTYITEHVNVWREDAVNHQVERTAALKNAPDKTDEYFKVPKVIDIK